MNCVVSYGTNQDTPGGKLACSSAILRLHGLGDRERVRAGQQLHREPGDRHAVVDARRGRTRNGAELDARDVLQAHRRAVGVGAQDDVLELLGRGEAAFGRAPSP